MSLTSRAAFSRPSKGVPSARRGSGVRRASAPGRGGGGGTGGGIRHRRGGGGIVGKGREERQRPLVVPAFLDQPCQRVDDFDALRRQRVGALGERQCAAVLLA